MKTTHNTIVSIATAAIAMIASAVSANAATRTLILLQQNGHLTQPDGSIVESPEAAEFKRMAAFSYQRFVDLTETNCTRAKLLSALIHESVTGSTVDLAIIGNGSVDSLALRNEALTGSPSFGTGNIRSLLTEARAQQGNTFNFKLRLVQMRNDCGGTLNDDWLAIGAKVSVGSPGANVLANIAPRTFWENFVKQDKRVTQAATDSFALASSISQLAPPLLLSSRPVVAGNGNIIFRDELQLPVNGQCSVTLIGNLPAFPSVYLMAGQRYTYTATGHPNLLGRRLQHPGNILSVIAGSQFPISPPAIITAGGYGFLGLSVQGINIPDPLTGPVIVTIKRVQ